MIKCPACLREIEGNSQIKEEEFNKYNGNIVDQAMYLIKNGHDCSNIEFVEMKDTYKEV